MPQHEEILTLTIADLSRSGSGVGRDEGGRVIFVPYTAPGDRVRVRVTSREKRFAEGELIELLQASSIRETPRCPAFGKCGGCQWQHIPYELQWKTKSSGVLHSLKRVQIEPTGPLEELPAEQIWEYRNRIQLRGEHRGATTLLGFHAARSHGIVSLNRCDIARPELNAAWETTRTEAAQFSKPFKVELEVAEKSGEVTRSWNSGHAAQGFRQVHDDQNEKLKAWVKSAVSPGAHILDLFGGQGNLSLPLAGQSPEIHCVDVSSPEATPPALPAHFRFHRAATADWLNKQAADRTPVENDSKWTAIIDPPRIGLHHDFDSIEKNLVFLGVKELIAVGCDPDSWARDVSRFVKRGWKLDRVAALDLFPQTPHIESLAKLSRS